MEASPARAKRVSVGDVIGETFSIYGQNLGPLLGSAIVVFAVVGLLAGLLQSTGGVLLALLAGVIRLAGHALYTGFVVNLVSDVRDGKRDQSVGDLFSAAAPVIVALIVFGILFAIGVGIGFVLLIVPGLVLITFWSLGAPAIVVERIGPLEAFGRSWRLVRGDAWSVFGVLLAVLAIVILIGFVLAAIATPIGDGAIWVASIASAAITAPIFSLAVSVLYFELREPAAPPPVVGTAPAS